ARLSVAPYECLLTELLDIEAEEARSISIDSHFNELTPLVDVEDGAEAVEYVHNSGTLLSIVDIDSESIVASTGLAGRAFESWQHSSGQMWLRDHLPDDVKGTRILLWRQGSKLRDCNSHLTTQNLQDVFLEDLLKLLQTQEVRPLVLIGHSLGGIIIKATFVKASQVQ
ncbi:hypothetical protein PtrEW7m1_011800, partial [Pyrenophora tritici-repentis]